MINRYRLWFCEFMNRCDQHDCIYSRALYEFYKYITHILNRKTERLSPIELRNQNQLPLKRRSRTLKTPRTYKTQYFEIFLSEETI